MGLAIVKKSVEDLGGTVTLESKLGEGTTFRVFWPALEERKDATELPSTPDER